MPAHWVPEPRYRASRFGGDPQALPFAPCPACHDVVELHFGQLTNHWSKTIGRWCIVPAEQVVVDALPSDEQQQAEAVWIARMAEVVEAMEPGLLDYYQKVVERALVLMGVPKEMIEDRAPSTRRDLEAMMRMRAESWRH